MSTDGLGAFVAERRHQLGLRQADLADAVNAHDRTYITAIEKGRIRLPEQPMRAKLAQALGVREIDLLVAAGELDPMEVREIIAVPLRLKPLLPALADLNSANLDIVLSLAGQLRDAQGV